MFAGDVLSGVDIGTGKVGVVHANEGAPVADLDLKRPIYQKTAAYGHFGREDDDFTWEKTDRAEALAKLANS